MLSKGLPIFNFNGIRVTDDEKEWMTGNSSIPPKHKTMPNLEQED